jgi:glycosyltransferase involved in cell wall biosynthesis/2-polyprenyl-3-methyl-5-hydroxy-6-metoxy-1,4-benzoquinol methylase
MVTACTIVARNYLAHARILAASFSAQHPNGVFTTLIIDDEERSVDDAAEPCRCLRLTDIGLAADEIGKLAAFYDVTELATAVKPPLLRHLLGAGAADVIYLDPDIKVYGSLEEAARLAGQHGIVITPHMLAPMPRDGRRVDEFHILAAGVYNLGFIAVGRSAAAFIDWWWDRTRREARIDPTRMMFTDQRWIDFAPSFFEHHILKDPTYNVAYWNLHERDVVWDGAQYLVDGAPLTFFHFSGFDPRKPYLLSKHQGIRPRILLSERPGVARICREYLGDLQRAGVSRTSSLPYGWNTLPSGLPFDRPMRRLYREGLDAFVEGAGPEPPCPFEPGMEARFIEWLNEPVAGGLRKTVSRYLYGIHQDRPDLQHAFPDLAGADADLYFGWIRRDGVTQLNIPPALLPAAPPPADDSDLAYAPPNRVSAGVNIAGYFRAELGVGEAARLLTAAIEAAGVPHSTFTYDVTPSRKAHAFSERGDRRAPYDVNILCVNADQTAAFARNAGPGFFEGRYTIGYWFWELDRFPPSMHHAFDYVDEVWTATHFVASGIRAIGRRPVTTIPLPVLVPAISPGVTRESLGLPSSFLFLFVFDFFSILERKNPIGLIDAFSRAFRPGEGPTLLIKTINGHRKLTDLERVRAAAAGRPDILIVDDYYSAEQKNSLMGLCDCYVSLHRSEGLGLTMAEAMALGKPVIATGYSGNIDFMTPENSYLVDYAMSEVPAECDPYPRGTLWADPSLDQAAEVMRHVYADRGEAMARGQRARTDILARHTPAASAAAVNERLAAIRRSRGVARAKSAGGGAGAAANGHRDEVAAALDRAESLLTPTASIASGRAFARPLLFVQNLLFRLLRPYWFQQRQLQLMMIQALREVARQAARSVAAEPHQRQALESVWQTLQSDVASRTGLEALATTLSTVTARLDGPVAAATSQVNELSERLYAVPYMDPGDRFYYTDNGQRVLGFRNGRGSGDDLYLGFEDIFRGSEAFIRDRLTAYLPLLTTRARVVEIGCGRGELLDLLRESGVTVSGVDIDEGMVKRCRARGHDVEQTDGVTFLRRQPDSSLPAVFCAQVVEHLPFEEFLEFLQVAHAKLQPGGQLIFETVNPHALEAYKTFWTDLTHQRPIFPEVALAWCWLVGFSDARVIFPTCGGGLERDRRTRGEYAVVASKGGGA